MNVLLWIYLAGVFFAIWGMLASEVESSRRGKGTEMHYWLFGFIICVMSLLSWLIVFAVVKYWIDSESS